MPEVEISIGGRFFEVACQEGEEQFLQSAARLLDAEASTLSKQMGRLSEGRLLLMAGLMLADKTAGIEDHLRELQEKLRAQDKLIAEMRSNTQSRPAAAPSHGLETLVSKSERIADLVERLAPTG